MKVIQGVNYEYQRGGSFEEIIHMWRNTFAASGIRLA